MIIYENQKIITTIKESGIDENESSFAAININALSSAMALLKTSTFKVWIYLAKNANNYTFALSCVDVCRFCKISTGTFHSAIQELIEIGYLVHTEDTHYSFYEILPKSKRNKTDNCSVE